jgi:putative hydrolase of the HAD superfamily
VLDVLQFKAVLFDLDDTLYGRSDSFARWAHSYIQNTLKINNEEEARALLAHILSLDDNGYGSKMAVIEEVWRHLPRHRRRTTIQEFTLRFYNELIDHSTLDKASLQLLSALDERNIPWGIVTNGSPRQWIKLEKFGLKERTNCLFVSGTFGREKPDATIYLAAAECLNTAPSDILFVGDHPINDVIGPHRIGMRTAWLHCGKPWPAECGKEPPDFVIDSLNELVLGFPVTTPH